MKTSILEKDIVNKVQQLLAIGPTIDLRDKLLALKIPNSEQLWTALLELQFHMTKKAEMAFFIPIQILDQQKIFWKLVLEMTS